MTNGGGGNLRAGDQVSREEAVVGELERIHSRVFSNSASTAATIQAIIVIFVGGILVFSTNPLAFIAVPVFWSVWALHALVTDRDTVKLAEYTRWLENQANAYFDQPVYRWETDLAGFDGYRGDGKLIYAVSYWVWSLLNLIAWIAAIAIAISENLPWLAIGILVVGSIGWVIAAYTMASRERFRLSVRTMLNGEQGEGPPGERKA